MQVVVYSREYKQSDTPHIQLLFDTLHNEGINAYVYAPYLESLKGHIQFRRDVGVFEGHLDFTVKKFDFFITLGGDGTILGALAFVRDSGVPIVGINLGRLGFLASIEKKRIPEAIRMLYRGIYSIDERSMLFLESNLPLFGDMRFALNDCTLLKRDTSSMITIHTYVNGAYLNSYWADGLIVATPTGSTGYSLSCGGPIIFPNSGNFVITPVAPHNLSVRPIVISDNSIISFEIEGRAENFLCTLDSRFESITSAHQLAVRKNDFPVRLVQLLDVNFLQTIRDKLIWGADSRN
ncbi:MAG TPA: NAD kinase [Saprospiraceae bacterium]|nr:NAD kinase [Saprospiraceae bacterium]HMP14052.1 NAD kinase [Saprospiraceae bacterium]